MAEQRKRAIINDTTEVHKLENIKKQQPDYRQLRYMLAAFDSLDQMYYRVETICDSNGRITDILYRDVNSVVEKLFGKSKEEIVGKTRNQLFGDLTDQRDTIFETYEKIVKSGKPAHFETYDSKLGKYYDAYAWKMGDQIVAVATDATEHKKAEEALKTSEKNYRHLLEYAPTAIFEMDYKTLRLLNVNDTTCLLSGYSKEELLSMNPFDLLEPESKKLFRDRVQRGLEGEKISEGIEFRVITKDGRHADALLYVRPRYKDGKLDRALVVGYDITEHKKAEEAIKSSEARFRSLFSNNMVAMAIWKGTGEIVDANDALLGLLGYTHAEVESGKLYWDKITPDRFHKRDSEAIAELEAKGFCTPYEKVFYHKDGREIPIIIGGGKFDKENKTGVLFVVDSTERKKAEEALKQRNEELERVQSKLEAKAAEVEEYACRMEELIKERTEKLNQTANYARGLLEASLDPLVTISPEGKITDVNRAAEQATGCSREELIGSDFSDYFTEPEKAEEGYKKVLAEGYVKDYPIAIKSKSGEVIEVLYNASIYYDQAGKLQGVFAAARDITERKKAETQALESARKLKDAERLAAIGATAGMVGHDIRNPLQAIAGDLYLAKSELEELPKTQQITNALESLGEIQSNIEYINKIVADLQDFARPLSPKLQESDLLLTVETVLKTNRIVGNVVVSYEVQNEARFILADPDFLRRIIGNLTLNAVQAMPNGGKLDIKAFKDKESHDVILTVKDTGVGIPEDVKGKLFTPMFTTKSKGQGFGLAAVKRLTEAMGGNISFESQLGAGTTFIVRLPAPKEINGKLAYK